MNYPLISEYIEAIKAAEDNFKVLTNLCPVFGDDAVFDDIMIESVDENIDF